MKIGLLHREGYTGEVIVESIGIPRDVTEIILKKYKIGLNSNLSLIFFKILFN